MLRSQPLHHVWGQRPLYSKARRAERYEPFKIRFQPTSLGLCRAARLLVGARPVNLSRGGVLYNLISSTVFFTDWNDLSNIAFSSALNSSGMIFSTPPAPMITGTPE